MKISIIGNGKMAKGIGTRLVGGGHDVTIHSRDVAKGETLASELKTVASDGVTVLVAENDTATNDVVILAVPYTEVAKVADEYSGLTGKVVIDITNPVDFDTFQLITEPGTSGAEEVATLLPEAMVVKAFNTTLAGTLVAGNVEGKELDVFIAGDNAESRMTVSELVRTSGMRPVDVGQLTNARHLEGFGLIQMSVQDQLGTNWMSALKFLG